MDGFDIRMEHEAVRGAVTQTPTLAPFVAEAVADAASAVTATEIAIDQLQNVSHLDPTFPS